MIAESPEVASLFEFFNGLEMGRRFGEEPADGEEFAWLISQKHPFVTMVLSRGYEVPEIIYPFSSTSRFQKGEGLLGLGHPAGHEQARLLHVGGLLTPPR